MSRDRARLTELESQAKRQDTKTDATQSSETAAPSGLSANQNSVLRMQQSQGNAAVRRMLVQRAAAGKDGGPIDDDVTHQINSARGGGQALDATAAEKIGGTMGADFSDVHVHTDAHADSLNRQLSAKAFTTGSDIFFQQGAYQPSSSEGQHLLAHELTHVVQQSGSSPSGSLTLGPANDSYEQEADHSATQAMSSLSQSADTTQRECEDCGDDAPQAMPLQRDEADEQELEE